MSQLATTILEESSRLVVQHEVSNCLITPGRFILPFLLLLFLCIQLIVTLDLQSCPLRVFFFFLYYLSLIHTQSKNEHAHPVRCGGNEQRERE